MNDSQEIVAKARAALQNGDHLAAKDFYYKAACIVMKAGKSEKNQSEAAQLLTHAGVLFVDGAFSKEAIGVLNLVNPTFLDKRWLGIYNHHYRLASLRIISSWATNHGIKIVKAIRNGKWNLLLKLLADYPYYHKPSQVAAWRALACRKTNKESLADLFEKDAVSLIGRGR